MKQSDIEEYKAILYAVAGIYAHSCGVLPLAITLWVLAGVSLLAGCVIVYYEQKIKKLKRLIENSKD